MVGGADVNQGQSLRQFPAQVRVGIYRGNFGMGKGVDVNQINPAVGTAKLVLHTRLQPQFFGLNPVGQPGDFMGTQSTWGQGIESADKSDANRSRRTHRGPGRDTGDIEGTDGWTAGSEFEMLQNSP